MKRLLMIGPGHGHNIKPFLDYFEKFETPFYLTFLSLKRFGHNKDVYDNVEIHEFTGSITTLGSTILLLRKRFDLIWYHGAYQLPVAILIYLFKNKNTKINLNIWGEKIPLTAIEKRSEFHTNGILFFQ